MTVAPNYEVRVLAMDTINYLHAPIVALYFLGAGLFAFCVLQKPRPLPMRRRRLTNVLMLFQLTTFVIEPLYCIACNFIDAQYEAPHSTIIGCLGMILVWGPLTVSLLRGGVLKWHPYLGAFFTELVLETTLSLSRGLSVSGTNDRDILFVFSCARTIVSLGLVLDGLLISVRKQNEKRSGHEEESLLGGSSDGPAQNGQAGYGATSQRTSGNTGKPIDRDLKVKEQQAKRLEEEGGWLGYLRGFSIFMPYLWPTKDRVVMLCLMLRTINLIQGRVFNILAPRQLGIITDKIASGRTTMPWVDIGLWTFYSWIKSYSGFGMVDSFANIVITSKTYSRISLMAYKHVMDLSMDFHTDKSSGEVLKAVEQASSLNTMVELMLFSLSPVFIDLIIAIWYVTHLFDAYMAFIVLFMGGAYVWFGIFFTTWNRDRRRLLTEKRRAENQVVTETLQNWHTVFYFNRAPYEYKRYGQAIADSIASQYRFWFGAAGGHAFQDLLLMIGFRGCCAWGISRIIAGEKPVGNLVTFIMYWETMMTPLYMMAYSWRTLTNALIDAERLLQLLQTEPSVKDAKDAVELVVKTGKVEFNAVDFAYDPRKQIIRNVSIIVEGGQTVAFVGETGGGKSTMLKLLARAYDVTGGSIAVDGQDLRSVTRSSLREIMGLVPQDPELFNTSIRENIRYGRLEATDAEIEDACRAAAIHDSIVDFPDGYDSKVGERGVKLSGGQLQRVAIARVLLRNPRIVLLDEATSSVDSATEAQIQEAFKKLSAGRTTFVIAHRLSTIVEADQIVVVDKGEIIERGTHCELLDIGGKYYELWQKQTAANVAHSSLKPALQEVSTYSDSAQLLIDITPPEEGIAKVTGSNQGNKEDGDRDIKKR